MTVNQISYLQAQETARANRAREVENERVNSANIMQRQEDLRLTAEKLKIEADKVKNDEVRNELVAAANAIDAEYKRNSILLKQVEHGDTGAATELARYSGGASDSYLLNYWLGQANELGRTGASIVQAATGVESQKLASTKYADQKDAEYAKNFTVRDGSPTATPYLLG